MITREQMKVGEKFKQCSSIFEVIAITKEIVVYNDEKRDENASFIESAIRSWEVIPKEKTKCKLIVWKFNSCTRLNHSVNLTDKENLCSHYRKELSDLEFYHEMELENQL